MEVKLILQFKEELEKRKKELEEKLKKLQKITDFGDDVDSLEEETDEAEEFTNQLAIAQVFKERLNNIELALRKIEENRYGICENCGGEISLEVLKITPESRLCKKCKMEE